jgi:hypothetical protein
LVSGGMARLRQVVLAARSADETARAACALLESHVTFRDPDVAVFGLRNALVPLGLSFLEVVSPLPGQERSSAAGRFVERFGEGGYMLLVQLGGPAAMSRAMRVSRKRGLRWIHEGGREQASLRATAKVVDGEGPGWDVDGVSGFHLDPRELGCIVELSLQRPRNKWAWAGNGWTRADERTMIAHSSSQGFAGATLAVEDPQRVAGLWVELLGLDAEERVSVEGAGAGVRVVLDDDGWLLFTKLVPGQRRGLVSVSKYLFFWRAVWCGIRTNR